MLARRLIPLGLTVALVTVLADQASKLAVLFWSRGWGFPIVPVMPGFDLVAIWNPGISYGLFPQGDAGRWVLVGLNVVAALVFTVWLTRAARRLEAFALGLLIGGAIGNAVDRVVHGAVFDFISLHAMGYRWYVFNVADVAVVVGVGLLLYDAFFGSASKLPPSAGPMAPGPEAKRDR